MIKIFYLIPFLIGLAVAQIEPPDGLRENVPGVWALQGGTVFLEPGNVKEGATVIVRDGLIEIVGIDIKIPKDARAVDMSGKLIYPGFIDSWVSLPIKKESQSYHDSHWNFKVHPRMDMSQLYKYDEKKSSHYKSLVLHAHTLCPTQVFFRDRQLLSSLIGRALF